MEISTRNVVIGGVIAGAFTIGGIYLNQSEFFKKPPPGDEFTVADCPEIPPVNAQTAAEGYVWVPEDFEWDGTQFRRIPGYLKRKSATPNEYIRGHWDVSSGNCTWVAGRFENDPGVSPTIRDNR